MELPEVPRNQQAEEKDLLMLPPAEEASKGKARWSFLFSWFTRRTSADRPASPELVAHRHWHSYYWAFSKEFGRERYRTWRGEVLFSVVLVGFIFLINRNPVDVRTVLLATVYSIGTFALWHAMRIPWRIYHDPHELHWGWGVLGITGGTGGIVLALGTAAWFYTMQPKVEMRIAPSTENQRIAELEVTLKNLEPFHEPADSLRRRTIKVSNDVYKFWSERPVPPQPVQNPSTDEERKRTETWNTYWRETDGLYSRDYKDRVLGIIREYKVKGIPTGYLEAGAENHSFGASPFSMIGSPVCSQDELCLFRELAFHVDARDQMINLNF